MGRRCQWAGVASLGRTLQKSIAAGLHGEKDSSGPAQEAQSQGILGEASPGTSEPRMAYLAWVTGVGRCLTRCFGFRGEQMAFRASATFCAVIPFLVASPSLT